MKPRKLDLGLFAIAYSAARERLKLGEAITAAADHGLEKIQRKNTLVNASRVRSKLVEALESAPSPRSVKRKNPVPDLAMRADPIREPVTDAFNRGDYRGLGEALVLVHVVPELARAEGRLARFVNVNNLMATQRPVYDIWIREDWPARVGKELASLESHLVLDADPTPLDEECRVAGVTKLWEVTFAVQGHGYALRSERGLAGEVDGSHLLVPYRTAHEVEEWLAVIKRGRRQLARRARKQRYHDWKAKRGA
jgi:hypothetical protein